MIHWGRPGRDHSSTGFPLEFRTNHLEGFAVITGRGNSEVALSKHDVCITSDVPMFATRPSVTTRVYKKDYINFS